MALLIAIGAALVADVALSLYGTKKLGLQEGNPLFRGKDGGLILWRLLAWKGIQFGALVYFRAYTAALVVFLCISVGVLAWNVVQIKKQIADNKRQ